MAKLPDQTSAFEHQIAGHKHEHGNLYTGRFVNNETSGVEY